MIYPSRPQTKVLHFGGALGLYGAERWILALLKNLNPAVVTSFVAVVRDAPEQDAPLCATATKLGIHSTIFEAKSSCDLGIAWTIRRYLKAQNIDILHTHGYKQDILGLIATRGLQCKIVATPHGWTAEPDRKLWLLEHVNRAAFVMMDAVVPLSPELYQGLERIPFLRKKLLLIENGLDIDEIDDETECISELHALRSRGCFLVGYVGRLEPGKRLQTLLHAGTHLASSNVHIVIVGEGPLRSKLESLAGDLGIASRTHFFGYRTDRLAFLKSLDLFVLPSASEGIPRCLLEAMASGIASIATDIPGCRELITHNDTGILFQEGDIAELAKMIARLQDNFVLRNVMAQRGREFVRARFSAAKMASRYENLYQRICEQTDNS